MTDLTDEKNGSSPDNLTMGPARTSQYDRPTDSMLQTIQSKDAGIGGDPAEKMVADAVNESLGSIIEEGSI